MKSNLIKRLGICLVLLVLICIIWVSFDKYENSVEKEEFAILDTSYIVEPYILESLYQIDKSNYLVVSREKQVDVNEGLSGTLLYNYTIYKHNIDKGKVGGVFELNNYYEYISPLLNRL